MRLIILPQALKITIPNIVNTTIGLFKDTTLVFIVGIFDFLKTIEAGAHRSELGDAGDQHHRLCLRRDLLFRLLLRACRATRAMSKPASRRATGAEGRMHGAQHDRNPA